MKVDGKSNISVFLYENTADGGDKTNGRKSADGKSVFAGGLRLGEDPVEEKRKKARDMAMELVKDVFAKDSKFDGELVSRDRRAKELIDENVEYKALLEDIDKERENLRELYKVPEGGAEDEELDLLRKARDAAKNPTVKLSEEEKERLDEINSRGKTPYQEAMLKLDDNEAEYRGKIEDNQMETLQEYAIVRGMKIEHLKQHDMVDAVEQGEKILKAASDEIIEMLRDEVKNNIDEQYEEEKEKAKEKKEEEEKLEERIEAAKADDYDEVRRAKRDEKRREEMFEISENMEQVKQGKDKEAVPDNEKSLNQVINELMLSTEDVKGLVVDEAL